MRKTTKETNQQLIQIIEAAIFAYGQPLSLSVLKDEVLAEFQLSNRKLRSLLNELEVHYHGRGIELIETASGFRFQTKSTFSPWVSRLWQEKAPKYSRALLETLSLIAYRQPITRGEIEQIRGVTVSSQIIRTLQDRGWIKVVGHKQVAGRPALFSTTPSFLDYFGLQCLSDLPDIQQNVNNHSDSGESDV